MSEYPLRWPEGWRKTPHAKRDRGLKFKIGGWNGSLPSFAGGRSTLMSALKALGAHAVVISSDVLVRNDGKVHGSVNPDRFTMENPGIAVYFVYNNKPMVMAQDAYDSPGCNLRSLTLAVEALRSLGRHGGGAIMGRAFDGFSALPPPAGSKPAKPWWEVLRYSADPTAPDREYLTAREVEARWRAMSMKAHPDQGGSHELMAELNAAKEQAVADLQVGEVVTEDDEEG